LDGVLLYLKPSSATPPKKPSSATPPKAPSSLLYLSNMFLSTFFYHTLNFGDVWITYFKSLVVRVVPILELEFLRDKKLQVKEVIYIFLIEP